MWAGASLRITVKSENIKWRRRPVYSVVVGSEDRAVPFPFPEQTPAQILPRRRAGGHLGWTQPRTRLVWLLTVSWVKVGSVHSPARRKRTSGRFR